MTTSTRTHRPVTFVAVATTGLVGALLAATPTSAYAIPNPSTARPLPAARHAHGHYVERACFMQALAPLEQAADGPLPRCYTYVPFDHTSRPALPAPWRASGANACAPTSSIQSGPKRR